MISSIELITTCNLKLASTIKHAIIFYHFSSLLSYVAKLRPHKVALRNSGGKISRSGLVLHNVLKFRGIGQKSRNYGGEGQCAPPPPSTTIGPGRPPNSMGFIKALFNNVSTFKATRRHQRVCGMGTSGFMLIPVTPHRESIAECAKYGFSGQANTAWGPSLKRYPIQYGRLSYIEVYVRTECTSQCT